jgi:hypothetical protein
VASEAAVSDGVNETVGGGSGHGEAGRRVSLSGRPGGAGQGRAKPDGAAGKRKEEAWEEGGQSPALALLLSPSRAAVFHKRRRLLWFGPSLVAPSLCFCGSLVSLSHGSADKKENVSGLGELTKTY